MIQIQTEFLVMVVAAVVTAVAVYQDWDKTALLALIVLVVSAVASCQNSEWHQRSEAERAEQERRNAIPHVIREADGCKVYAWKGGDSYHYFTRCGPKETVTTERHYTVKCGHKNQQNCDRKEVTVTEPEK
jgi:hypothetical protein